MNKIQKDFNDIFRKVGILFSKFHVSGFRTRKPKKIMAHARQVLRTYRRETSSDIFSKLSGTILTWRYVKLSNIPAREMLKLERSVLRSFNFLLRQVSLEEKEDILYLLLSEAGPRRSAMNPGNPLGHLINLKLLEFEIQDSKTSAEDRDKFEENWKELHTDLHRKFRFRIPLTPIS